MTTANGQTPAPFMQDMPAVISTLGTDAHQGLTSERAAHNLNQYGPNAFTKPKPESMLSRIVKTAADPMLIMLMIAAAITLGVNITRAMAGGHANILECVGIFFAIALSVTITVVMEGRSAKTRAVWPMKAIPSNRTSQSLWIWWTDSTPITERDRQIPVGLFSFAVGQMRG